MIAKWSDADLWDYKIKAKCLIVSKVDQGELFFLRSR